MTPTLRALRLCVPALGLGALVGVCSLSAADPVPAPRPKKAEALSPCRGIEINGPDLTGTEVRIPPLCAPLPQLKAAHLAKGVSSDGKAVARDAVLQGGCLHSPSLPAVKLVGALLIGEAENGRPVRLRIDEVAQSPDPRPETPDNENGDVCLYRVSVQRGTGDDPSDATFRPQSAYAPLCPDGKLAIAVPGVWDYASRGEPGHGGKVSQDPHEVTFACIGSAVAKCVTQMGYKPWKTATATAATTGPAAKPAAPVSLDELHQACVRAVRADYCGDGESLTKSGERVNFYDRFGIERDAESWPLEALWGPGGALCVNSTRLISRQADERKGLPAVDVHGYIRQHCPTRFSEQPCDATQTHKGTLLWTETPAQKSEPRRKS